MFSSLFGRKGQSRLYSIFQHLDEVEKDLASRIERYVLEGEDPTVVNRVSLISDKQKVNAGLYVLGYYYRPKKDEVQIAKRQKAVQEHIGQLALEPFMQDADALRRLAMLVDSLYSDYDRQHFHCTVPSWFKTLYGYLDLSYGLSQDKQAWLQHCGPDWFEAKPRANDIEHKQIFAVFLEYVGYHHQRLVTDYRKAIDWSAVVKTPTFLSMIDSLHISGRLKLIEILKTFDDLNEHLPLLVRFASASSKELRTEAQKLLSSVNLEAFAELALASFSSLPVAQRKELAALLVLQGNESVITQLQHLIETDKSKAVRDSLAKGLADKAAASSVSQALDIPDYEPLPAATPLSKDFAACVKRVLEKAIEQARLAAEKEVEANKEREKKQRSEWRQRIYQDLKTHRSDVKLLLNSLSGDYKVLPQQIIKVLYVDEIIGHDEFHLRQATRLSIEFGHEELVTWLSCRPSVRVDLRQLIPLLKEVKQSQYELAKWYLGYDWRSPYTLPQSEMIDFWPFFAENTDYLDEAFELIPPANGRHTQFEVYRAILVLGHFPVIPEKYLQILYRYALSSSKTLGPVARETIESYGLVPARIFETLSSSKQDERIVAAEWIQRLGLKEAIEPIQKALKKERSETAKAALLSCLSSLGESIDSYLAPGVLLAEAEKGLKKAIPKSIGWFAFDDIPLMTWKGGDAVDPKIIQWWLVLAAKLKQPEGNPLLNLYLAELSPDSQRDISRVIFEAFIKEDTQNPTDEEAASYATANQQHWFDIYQRWAEGDSDWAQAYKNKTLQSVYNELFKKKKSEYLGSAIAAKGILCLAGLGNAADLVQLISSYMKQHYTRRHQIEAMLSSLAHNDDPAAIQLMLSIARRHRTKSVQEKAKALVEVVAERNGWSHDELADRTIPSAGFEMSGSQILELGSRPITIRLSEQLKPVIENEQGKVLKALPAARKDDDEAKVKEAKKQFSTLKKELKQVVELQTARLYEAMCLGREWPFEEWEEYLFNHPIMTHITQRLVWVVKQDDDLTTIRPTAERELIDIDDEEFEAGEGATIKVAHIGDLSAEQAKQWQQLIKEEKLKQPFDQLAMPKTALTDEMLKSKKLDYHLGWMTDTYVVRGVMTKLGYKRGEAEDAGFFGNYYKEFASLNISAVFEFSGNCLPEEQYPAAIYHMCFIKSDQRYGWSNEDNYLSLAELPKALVMEVMRDYEAVAAKAAFEKDWEKKCPW